MKTGYPFLAISKKHNVPYEHVLLAVGLYKQARIPTFIKEDVEADILSCMGQHRDIAEGRRPFEAMYDLAA